MLSPGRTLVLDGDSRPLPWAKGWFHVQACRVMERGALLVVMGVGSRFTCMDYGASYEVRCVEFASQFDHTRGPSPTHAQLIEVGSDIRRAVYVSYSYIRNRLCDFVVPYKAVRFRHIARWRTYQSNSQVKWWPNQPLYQGS